MVIIGCTDKAVIGNVHEFPQVTDTAGTFHNIVNKFLRGNTGFPRFDFNFLSVFIGSGEKHDVLPLKAVVTGEGIGCNGAVGMPDVQFVRWIINRRCNVKTFHIFSFL